MIVLFTDFGARGPYVGQLQAVLAQKAPGVPVIELFNDAPRFDAHLSAHLLAAYVEEFPVGTVFLCVVDPGVGSASRLPLMAQADGRWFVGPHNGLFDVVLARAARAAAWEITWAPARLSASFHGRDLFAPVAAELARGNLPAARPLSSLPGLTAAADLARVIYIDAYGNAMTGLRVARLSVQATLTIHGQVLPRARTFSDVGAGVAFWYENANGLAEVTINQGAAAECLGIRLGDALSITPPV